MNMEVELEHIKLSKNLIKVVLAEGLLRQKRLPRTLVNYVLSEFELSGRVLDLGSGSNSASYNRFLKRRDSCNIKYSDYYRKGENLLKVNLEEPFQVEKNSLDCVMCFNALEHVYNFKNVVRESYRILRKGGVFIGCTPFMHIFHPDPCDYFRYSHEALLRIFEEENFVCKKMVYVGFGPFSLGGSLWISLLPKALGRVLVFVDLLNILLDVILDKYSKSYRMIHPFAYVYVFEKFDNNV